MSFLRAKLSPSQRLSWYSANQPVLIVACKLLIRFETRFYQPLKRKELDRFPGKMELTEKSLVPEGASECREGGGVGEAEQGHISSGDPCLEKHRVSFVPFIFVCHVCSVI